MLAFMHDLILKKACVGRAHAFLKKTHSLGTESFDHEGQDPTATPARKQTERVRRKKR